MDETPRSSPSPDGPPRTFPPPPDPGIPQWNEPPGYGPPSQGLYPLDLGRLFSLTFSVFRYRWLKFVGVALLVMTPAWVILSVPAVVDLDSTRWFSDIVALARGAAFDTVWPTLAQSLVVNLVAGLIAGLFVYVASGAVTDMAATTYAGERPVAWASIRTALARLGSLVGVAVVVFLITAAIVAVGVVVGVALFALTAVNGRVTGGPPVFLGIVAFVATIATLLFLTIRWTLAIPVVILERAGALAALRRSWRLISGSSWRVLGYLLVFGLVVGLIGVLPSLIITFVVSPPQITPGFTVVYDPGRLAIANFLVGLISSALSPIVWIAMTLLYFDLRWRHGETVPHAGQSASAVPPASTDPLA